MRIPIPVCAFARVHWCRRVGDTAISGRNHSPRQTCSGFCLHVRCDRSGRIEAIQLAGVDQSDLALLPEIVPCARALLADRTSWSPDMTAALAPSGPRRDAPFRHKTFDPTPQRNAILGSRRGRIASTFAQLVERSDLKQIWARDLWHVGNRLVPTVLSHTIAMQHFNAKEGNPPLRLALLLV